MFGFSRVSLLIVACMIRAAIVVWSYSSTYQNRLAVDKLLHCIIVDGGSEHRRLLALPIVGVVVYHSDSVPL